MFGALFGKWVSVYVTLRQEDFDNAMAMLRQNNISFKSAIHSDRQRFSRNQPLRGAPLVLDSYGSANSTYELFAKREEAEQARFVLSRMRAR